MKLKIFMKSGNVIVVPHVKDYSVDSKGDEVVRLSITRRKYANWWFFSQRLLVSTIALGQIEAIVVA